MRGCIRPVELSAWIDGELPLARSWAVERHVERCPRCAAEAASLERVRSAVNGLGDSDAALRLARRAEAQRVLKRIRAEVSREVARWAWGRRSRERAGRIRGQDWAFRGAAAAFIAAILMIVIAYRLPGAPSVGGPPPAPEPANSSPSGLTVASNKEVVSGREEASGTAVATVVTSAGTGAPAAREAANPGTSLVALAAVPGEAAEEKRAAVGEEGQAASANARGNGVKAPHAAATGDGSARPTDPGSAVRPAGLTGDSGAGGASRAGQPNESSVPQVIVSSLESSAPPETAGDRPEIALPTSLASVVRTATVASGGISDYYAEHQRFAVTLGADPDQSPAEATVRRLDLAVTPAAIATTGGSIAGSRAGSSTGSASP